MFYLQLNALELTIKSIVLPSFSRHILKLLSKCCIFKVRQYSYMYIEPTSHHGPLSTRQRNASCLISNIIGTYLVQAQTVWVQIRFQVLSKIVSMIRKYHHQTHGTTRKSHTTITRHQEDKLSKATSSLFPIKMIAKLEWT